MNQELILYKVTNTINGCTETTSVLVNEITDIPVGLDILMNPPPCFGDGGSIEILSVQGGTEPYLYSLDGGQTYYDSSIFSFLDPGNYDVSIQDANGCEYGESVFIPETPELIVTLLEPQLIIQLGEGGQLNAIVNIPQSQIDTIIWTPTDSLSCTNCLDPITTAVNETYYEVTVIDINGCEATDEMILRVKKERDIFIPNAFSPNNDGINDIFMIFAGNDKVREINAFQVFDRWGELVFEENNFQPNDPVHGWDGNLKGEPLNPGVFVYWAEVTFIDDVVILYKGDVTLMR